MKRATAIILLLSLLNGPCVAEAFAAAKGPVWEVVAVVDSSQPLSEQTNLQVETRDGYIYITLDRPEQVEVYTILGQLVTRRKLPAGTTRLQLSQRGIYILKSGGMTRRVNL